MPEPTTRPEPVRWNVCPDCGERHDGGAACHPELQGTPVSSIPRHQKAGYDAVYEVIRAEPGDAWRNATIWRAVEAYRAASKGVRERQVREQTLRDLNAGRITTDDLTAAGLHADHVVDLRVDGWTIQHPLTCRGELFACPVNRAAERDLTGPPHEFGQFVCGFEDGEFWIGEAR